MTLIIWIYFDFMAVELSKKCAVSEYFRPFFQDNPNVQYLVVIQHYCVFMTWKNRGKREKNKLDWMVVLQKS